MQTKKRLTVFIVDDNPAALQTLADDLHAMPEVGRVFTFSTYAQATLPLLEKQPDVLFLDVEVPGCTGVEFLTSIKPRLTFSFKVVFYSAFSHYMIDAIRQSAADFLLKPYKPDELREVMDRLVRDLDKADGVPQLAAADLSRRMAMQTISELLLISAEQILLLSYQSHCRSWQLTLTDRSTHLLKKGMTAENLLALHPNLARINNTCIINLAYLAAIENNTQRCRLCPPFEDMEVTASRRYFSKLKERFELL